MFFPYKKKVLVNLSERKVSPELKGEHCVCSHLVEPSLELSRRKAVLVEPVVPADSSQHLHLAADQPVPGRQDLPDVRVVRVGCPKLARAPLLLSVLVELRVPEHGLRLPVVAQGEGSHSVQPGFILWN